MENERLKTDITQEHERTRIDHESQLAILKVDHEKNCFFKTQMQHEINLKEQRIGELNQLNIEFEHRI